MLVNQKTEEHEMTNNEIRAAEKLRAKYETKVPSKFDELRALDREVRRPAEAFAYGFGTAGSLVLGTGMCFAMGVIGNLMVPGIGIGLVGIAMVSGNYHLYRKFLEARKKKYSDRIFAMSDEILNRKVAE